NQVDWLEDLLKEQKKLLHPQNLYIFATLNKLDNIIPDNDKQHDEVFKKLESETKITLISDYDMYKNVQITIRGYNHLKMISDKKYITEFIIENPVVDFLYMSKSYQVNYT
ncbi:hypothetical protein PIROE2DRAFT_1330, partial [Piromyces sp. E2]